MRTTLLACALALAACGDRDAFDARASHARMLAALEDVAARTDEDNVYLGSQQARRLRAELERLGASAPWRLYVDAGMAELQLGHEREGIAILERARDGLRAGSIPGDAAALAEVNFFLGFGYLRLGETENCCELPTAESCILPIRGGALHQRPEGSRKAIVHFEEILKDAKSDSYWNLATQWLLNVAHMTLGEYPAEVPERWRIPEESLRSPIEFPPFRNVAPELGLDTFSLSGGAIADDFDGDDRIDLVVSTWESRGQIRFFRNDGDGTFTDRTSAAGLDGLFGGLNLVQADYDDDGDLDLVVLRGAWLFENGRHPNSLLRNEGDGTFTDVTFAAGLGDVHWPTQTAAWADYDRDGDLDLYVGNESSDRLRCPSQLFRNEGDGTFTDVAAEAGVENFRFAKGVTWGDFDGDGHPDLYVSNNGQPNRLYRNQGNGRFLDVAIHLGVSEPIASFPTWFWDFDNDGALDLFVACYGTGIGHVAAHYAGRPVEWEVARMYRGNGRGGFEDVAREVGLDHPALPMGANFGDLDNDGWLDFYLGTGNTHFWSLMPNLMFLNREGRRVVDVTMAGGFGHLQKGHGIAFADLDDDGDLDVFEQIGGAYLGDAFHDVLFENPGFDHAWIRVHLVGTESNRSAIGARLRVDVREGDGVRSIHRHVSSGGSFGANPLRQTIGLGDAREIVAIEIDWPLGRRQRVEAVRPGRSIRVVEGEPGFTELDLPPVTFGER